MPNYKLTDQYQQVKSSGAISTMRVRNGFAMLVKSSSKPAADADSFPMGPFDQPFTFAADMQIWAKGSGVLHTLE